MSEKIAETELTFVRYILGHLASHVDSLVIEKTIDDKGVLISLQADKEDMGRIIGKNGQTIKSIRTLLRVIGARQNEKITLKILEPLN